MKKVLMITLMLMFFVGTASATTYMGLFVSAVDHDGSEDCTVTPAAYEAYDIYLMLNVDLGGFQGFQMKMVKTGADYGGAPTDHPNGGLWMNSELDPNGVAATGFLPCFTDGWYVISIMHFVYNPAGGANVMTIEAWPGLATPLYLDCENVETPLSINTNPFGVNTSGTPTNESSWGAVKSLYR